MEIKSVHMLTQEEGWDVFKAKFVPWLMDLKQGLDNQAIDINNPLSNVVKQISPQLEAINKLTDPKEYKEKVNGYLKEILDIVSSPENADVVKQGFFAYLTMLRFYRDDTTMISLDVVKNIAANVPELQLLDKYPNLSVFKAPEKKEEVPEEEAKAEETSENAASTNSAASMNPQMGLKENLEIIEETKPE